MPPALTESMADDIRRNGAKTKHERAFLEAEVGQKMALVSKAAKSGTVDIDEFYRAIPNLKGRALASLLSKLGLTRNHILADSAIATIHDALTHSDMFETVKQNPEPLKNFYQILSNRRGELDEFGAPKPADAEQHLAAFDAAPDDVRKKAALKKAANAASMGLSNLRFGGKEDNIIILHGLDRQLTDAGQETEKTKEVIGALHGLLVYSKGVGQTPAKKKFADHIFSVGGATMSKLPVNRGRMSSDVSASKPPELV